MSTTEDNMREQVPGWLLAQALCCLPLYQVVKGKDKDPQHSDSHALTEVLIDAEDGTVTFENRVDEIPVTLLLYRIAYLDTQQFIDARGCWEPPEECIKDASNLVLQFKRSDGITLVTRQEIEQEVHARKPGEHVWQSHMVRAYAEQAKLYQLMADIINKQHNTWRYNR